MLAILTWATTSCKSISSYKTLATVATTVDFAMKGYSEAVTLGQVNVMDQARVRQAHGDYSKAMQVAVAAARFNYAAPANTDVQLFADTVTGLIRGILSQRP